MQEQELMNRIKNLWLGLEARPALLMALLLGFSLVIKGTLVFQTEIINPDGIRYINSASELFQGNFSAAFSHEKMLGFTFLLGLSQWLVADWFLAGKLLSSVAVILTTIPLYLIARELFGTRAALFAAFVFTVAPVANGKCDSVIKDPVFLFLIVSALCLLVFALKNSRLSLAFMAGVISCLSVLIRPEGIIFFSTVILFLGVSAICSSTDKTSALKVLVCYGVFPLGVLLLVVLMFAVGAVPFDVLSKTYAKFAYYFQTDLTQNYKAIYQHLKDVEETFPGGEWTNDYFEFARYYIFLIYLLGMIQLFCKNLFPVFLLPLAFGLNLKGLLRKPVLLLLSVLVSFLLMDYVFLISRNFLSGRYLLVPVVLTFILIGYGMDRMYSMLSNVRLKTTMLVSAIALFWVLPVALTLFKSSEEKLEIKQAGLWLQENRDARQSKMILNEERIAYYSGLFRKDYEQFNDEILDGVEQKAMQSGVDLIVIYTDKKRIESLLAFKDFELVKIFPGRKKIVSVYERKI